MGKLTEIKLPETMSDQIQPVLVVVISESQNSNGPIVRTKGLVSSLLRSLYSGRIVVIRQSGDPLYKVERTAVEELWISRAKIDKVSNSLATTSKFHFNLSLVCDVEAELRQWVIVANSECVVLRNPDHLIPPDAITSYGANDIDFYWSETDVNCVAAPGFWAVRKEHFKLVLDSWHRAWSEALDEGVPRENEIWNKVVRCLPLRKRRFEKGEVVAPSLNAVDWEAVSNACLVTLSDWPEEEAGKFLQALFFGRYLGDESGMLLRIMDV